VAVTAVAALAIFGLSVWAITHQEGVRRSVERLLGLPPVVTAQEAYDERPGGPTFDHSTFDGLLRAHVDEHGWSMTKAFGRTHPRSRRTSVSSPRRHSMSSPGTRSWRC
jgi:hypothetical protein